MIRRTRKKLLSTINVVPYIDVMLVLLVIFMITTPLINQGIAVHLPKAKGRSLINHGVKPLIISIDRYGHYYLNATISPLQPLTYQAVVRQLSAKIANAKKQGNSPRIFIKGDSAVDYGKVVMLMSLLQQAGITKVALMISPLKVH